MHDFIEELYELCETLEKDLEKTNEKVRLAGGELSGSDLEYIDKLTHSIKSIKTTIAMVEADGGFSYEGGSYTGGSYAGRGGGNRGGGGGNRGGRSREGGMSGARGYRRDNMGRFSRESGRRSREGMSYDGAREELMEHVDELADMAKDEETKAMIQKLKRDLKEA